MNTREQSQVKVKAAAMPSATPSWTRLLQRKCACGGTPGPSGECAECRRKRLTLQRRVTNQAESASAPPIVHEVLRSPGQPLDARTRAFMEPRFGHNFGWVRVHAVPQMASPEVQLGKPGDRYEQEANRVAGEVMRTPHAGMANGATRRGGYDFGRVRVHTDAKADESARAVNALAYTVGSDVVFAAGRYAPGTPEGRRLLAHELAHVAQQESGARRATVRRQAGTAEKEKKAKAEAEEAKKETLGAVLEYETNWKEIRAGATEFADMAPWLTQGDSIVALIRAHTVAGLEASEKGDRALYLAYKTALESDVLMYEYVAWHTVVYVNLLGLKSDIERLTDALDADKREFTGRAEAERLLRDFRTEIAKVPANAAEVLKLVRVDIPMVVRKGRANEVTINVTSAAIEQVRPVFEMQAGALITLQSNIQAGVTKINAFLATARAEGLAQAVDAVQQIYDVRGTLRGRGPKASKAKPKGGGKKQTPKKKPAPQKKPEEKPEEKKPEAGKKPEEKKPEEKPEEERGRRRRDRWTCIARCNIVNFSNVPNAPERVEAPGFGPDQGAACNSAIAAAQALAPRGTYTRHCHCRKQDCWRR